MIVAAYDPVPTDLTSGLSHTIDQPRRRANAFFWKQRELQKTRGTHEESYRQSINDDYVEATTNTQTTRTRSELTKRVPGIYMLFGQRGIADYTAKSALTEWSSR